MANTLFDETTQRKLEQVSLVASRVRAGAIKGDRRSNKRGTSIEFADYRNYTPGDDLRRLDWNIYARLDRPLMKVFEDEEDLATYILLDTSASMAAAPGEDEGSESPKFLFARRLAAGLAYISLQSNDRLTLASLSAEPASFGPARGRAYGSRLLTHISGLRAAGVTDLNAALTAFALRVRRGGLVVLISDLFSPTGFMDGATALLARGCEVVIVQVLTPEEIAPTLTGDLRLVDVETGAAQEVSLDGPLLALYARRMQAWREDMRSDCARRGMPFVPVSTDMPWEKVILQDLRRVGVVR